MSLGKRRHEDYYPEQEWWNLGILSNYCGPGGGGDPQHPTDNLCREHDADYRDIDQAGGHSYLTYSEADNRLVKKLRARRPSIDDVQEMSINVGADTYFSGKSHVAPFSKIDPPTQARRKKLNLPQSPAMPYLRSEEDMDVEQVDTEPAVTAAAAAASSGSGGKTPSGSRETPITPANPTYGLEDTHTTVLPLTQYFALFSNSNPQKPSHFVFSLVDPLMPITTPITDILVDSTAAYVACGNRKILLRGDATNAYEIGKGYFPYESTVSTVPGWWNWHSKTWRSYTILGVQWDLIVRNPGIATRDDVLIAYGKEAYTPTDDSGKFPDKLSAPDLNLNDVRHWEGMQWKIVEGSYTGFTADNTGIWIPMPRETNTVEHLGGTHRPYQTKGLVQNDQDTKRWNLVNTRPTYREDMHLFVFGAPLATGTRQALNCELTIKYIVQFKDRVKTFKYPYWKNSATTTLASPGDIIQSRADR